MKKVTLKKLGKEICFFVNANGEYYVSIGGAVESITSEQWNTFVEEVADLKAE